MDHAAASLPGIGPKRAALLAGLGIETVRDLLLHLPRGFEDRRVLGCIADAAEGAAITVAAEVLSSRHVRLRGRMSMAVVRIGDASGAMTATFFGRGYLAQSALRPGARALFSGVVGQYNGPALKNPVYELLDERDEDTLHLGRIVPMYRLCEGVTQRMLRRWIAMALDAAGTADLPDAIPARLRAAHGFAAAGAALRAAHFPDAIAAGEAARVRFAYEELLAIQTGVLRERAVRLHEARGIKHRVNGPHLKALGKALPFALTGAQDRVISEVLRDMASPRPMARLLQGDVGCGKTVVAVHAVAAAADGGYQTAIMAPTEILAGQHARHFRALLAPLGIAVELLTGSQRGARALRARAASGAAPVVVGTHALAEEATVFGNLGLAIVDEQHRFGVRQRERLAAKGAQPDVLHMTATPIPRTLALTVYGGMDLSLIDELPPGRTPVKTRRVPEAKLPDLYRYLVEQAAQGLQTYVVCPLIESSEKRARLRSVVDRFEMLSRGPLAGLRTALLHGRMDAAAREAIIESFRAGAIDVLFSTTVIEVGIDVPAASAMVIENAGEFGLTQLHQLRGRVGRGAAASHCFLLGEPSTEEGRRRLEVLCRCSSGFDIAEEDLALRGMGELHGVRQAGLSDLRVACLVRDARLLDAARRDAEALLEADPRLEAPEHAALKAAAARYGGFAL